ncbi:MAG: DUF1150 family protein [Paracoccaceae bacterium]|nr:DUF1150 family protein [Paracoccaceae bacterium]
MNTKYDFPDFEEARIVYVRPVAVADLPKDVQGELDGLDEVYAVHSADGERLALVKDRSLAFILARQNDFAPVTVH